MHSELEEFLVVLSALPTEFLHLLNIVRQHIRIERLRVARVELHAFLFGEFDDFGCQFARQFARLAENHTPHRGVHTGERFFAHRLREQVHQSGVLHVLREWRYETRRTEHRPYTLHFLEEFNQQFVLAEGFLATLDKVGVDSGVHTLEVRHQRAHHTARQTAADKQRGHLGVAGVDPIAEEVVDKRLRQAARLHIGFHIDVLYKEACVAEHRLDGDHIGMHHTPTERLHSHIEHVNTRLGNLEHRSHRETGTRMSVILENDAGVFLFDSRNNFAQHSGATDTCHILETDFLCTALDELLGKIDVILHGMHLGIGDTHRGLGSHTCLFRPTYGRNDIAGVVETAENTGDVHALCVLHFVHQLAHVGRHWVHTEGVQTAVEHVGLDTDLVERLGEGANRLIGVLAIEEVHLLTGTTVGLHTVETAHIDDNGCNLCQLVFAWNVLAAGLPHIAVNQRELNFFLHIVV